LKSAPDRIPTCDRAQCVRAVGPARGEQRAQPTELVNTNLGGVLEQLGMIINERNLVAACGCLLLQVRDSARQLRVVGRIGGVAGVHQ